MFVVLRVAFTCYCLLLVNTIVFRTSIYFMLPVFGDLCRTFGKVWIIVLLNTRAYVQNRRIDFKMNV